MSGAGILTGMDRVESECCWMLNTCERPGSVFCGEAGWRVGCVVLAWRVCRLRVLGFCRKHMVEKKILVAVIEGSGWVGV